jgi:single-strand DNA-binding protein
MKVCTIAGRLTRDCQVQTYEERQFASFSVAVDDGYGKNKGVMYFEITYYRSGIAQYLTKGTRVCVSGDLRRLEHNGKTYLTISASDVSIQGGGKPRDEHTSQPQPAMAQMDDEIPF